MVPEFATNSSSGVPTGVKVISVLYYIGAALLVIGGILFMFGAGFLSSVLGAFASLGTGLFVVLGIVLLLFGVLYFFVGRGLWKARNWARIVAIILSVLGLLGAISSLVQGRIGNGIVNLLFNAIVGGYLLLSSQVKAAFSA